MAGNEYFCKNERRLFFLYKTRRLSQWLYMAISIDDIKDKKSLEAWLNDQLEAVRQNCAVFIAARSALRVLPIAVDGIQFSDWWRNDDLTAIVSVRSVLILSVAAKLPTNDMRKTAYASVADTAAVNAYATAISAAYAYAYVSDASAADASAAYIPRSAASTEVSPSVAAASAAAYASAAAADGWRNVRADCVVWVDHAAADGTCGIDVAPLIDGEFVTIPDWAVVREKLLNDSDPKRGADWSFWVHWYDKILRGDPQDWDMLYEIAVSQDIDWEASPREVNAAIGRIVAVQKAIDSHALDQSIRLNSKTKKLESFPIEKRDLEGIVRGLRRAVNRFVKNKKSNDGANNQGVAVMRCVDTVIARFRREITQHKENPGELARCIELACGSMQRRLSSEGLNLDHDFQDLIAEIQVQEETLIVSAPEVAEFRKARLKVRVEQFQQQYRLSALRMATGMMMDSHGPLQAVLSWAIIVLSNPDSDVKQQKLAITYVSGALPRGAQAMVRNNEKGSDPSKTDGWLNMLEKTGDKVIKADKVVDVAQEAIEEGGPWATEVYTQIASGNFWAF